LGFAGVTPLGMEGVADRKKHALLYMCYLAESDRSALKYVDVNRGENPKIGDRWSSAPWTGA